MAINTTASSSSNWGSAAGQVGSTMGTAAAGYYLQRKANTWNREMFGKRHQMEVNDLIAAGLNPILSASGGSPGNVPGAVASPVSDPFSAAMASRQAKAMFNYTRNQVKSEAAKYRLLTEQTTAQALQNELQREVNKFKTHYALKQTAVGTSALPDKVMMGLEAVIKDIANSAKSTFGGEK